MSRLNLYQAGIPALALALMAACAAHADVYMLQTAPGYVVRSAPNLIQPAPVIRKTFMAPMPVTTTTTTRTMTQSIVVPPTESVTRTITSRVLVSPTLGAVSDFRARLDRISEQIAMGQSRGWLSSTTASGFQAEYSALAARADDLISRGGGSTIENGLLEQEINVLNQRVTQAMSSAAI